MEVSFIQPRTELQPYTESLWVFESVVGMPQTDSSIAAPNGCSKLLISRAICAALIVAVTFGAYSEIAMVRVEARSTVSATASVLWKIMMEVDKYPEWYSAMLEASGTPRLGGN